MYVKAGAGTMSGRDRSSLIAALLIIILIIA